MGMLQRRQCRRQHLYKGVSEEEADRRKEDDWNRNLQTRSSSPRVHFH